MSNEHGWVISCYATNRSAVDWLFVEDLRRE